VGNDGVGATDILGKSACNEFADYGEGKICGTVTIRAIDPEMEYSWWGSELFTRLFAPHHFVTTYEGEDLTHGGNSLFEDHWTADTYDIYVFGCDSCEEFDECMKGAYGNAGAYKICGNNCRDVARSAVRGCGGCWILSGQVGMW
jgi:hypothetical protein